MRPVHSPVAGLFRHPCGVWVSPFRMVSGAVTYLPLPAASRRSLLCLDQCIPLAGEGI